MNRREFLKYSAFLAAAATVPALMSCDGVTPRYAKPDPLVLPGEKLLLTGVSVIDVSTGLVTPRQILIQNSRIQGVFDPEVPGIACDRVVDLKGAYMTPGLINAHCHLSIPCTVAGIGRGLLAVFGRQIERNAEECIKHGVTTVRDMGALSGYVHGLRQKVSGGEVVGPRMQTSFVLDVPGGYMTSMLGAYGLIDDPRYFKIVHSPQEARDGVKRAVDEGADLVKICHQALPFATILTLPEQMDCQTTRAICDEAARQGIPVALHHTDSEGFLKGLDAGVISFEHVVCDRALTRGEITRFKESGAMLIPTASVGFAISWETTGSTGWDEGFKALVASERDRYLVEFACEFCEPVVADAIAKEAQRYSDPAHFDTFHLTPTVYMKATENILDYGVANLIRMYREGVAMGCGNDGGIPFDFPGAMGLEMYLLEQAGMDRADILRMATLDNARLLGLDRDFGSVEPGKIADLVIFEQNPLETLKNTFRPRMVFQGGELAFCQTA